MPNESKLGLLAGVAGVVMAAVLFYQSQPTPPQAVGTPAKPSAVSGKPVKSGSEVTASPVVSQGRKEPAGRTVSRSGDEDE